MNEEKKSELDTVTIKNETLRKYFPRNYTPRQMESIIIKLLDQWQLKKQQAKQKKQEEALIGTKRPSSGSFILQKYWRKRL